jgi:hypothetical protein
MTPIAHCRSAAILVTVAAALLGAAAAFGQAPAPAPAGVKPGGADSAEANPAETKPGAPRTSAPSPLAPLAWLDGCWRGLVNGREFREHWMPLRGGMLIGVSQTVLGDTTLDFEYLRVEPRADGVYYVILPPGKGESAFKLTEQPDAGAVERKDEEFVFTNPALEFPKKIIYRRGTQGWLYATVAGTVKGAEQQVTYPMRRIDCQSGELLPR